MNSPISESFLLSRSTCPVFFGFIRDTWNPFGMRDRGFMLLFGAVTAALYVAFAFTPLYIWHTSPRDVALDELVFVCRERTERTDIDTRPATCDVGLNQRDLEHLSVDPYGRGVAPRRHAERCT
jgi:hypothetical protein